MFKYIYLINIFKKLNQRNFIMRCNNNINNQINNILTQLLRSDCNFVKMKYTIITNTARLINIAMIDEMFHYRDIYRPTAVSIFRSERKANV